MEFDLESGSLDYVLLSVPVVPSADRPIIYEILPRFISKPQSNKGHIRIFSDRDPLFYWLYARYEFGARHFFGIHNPTATRYL